MSWYVVESLDDALAETRALLLPFDADTWLRLAVVTLLAGLSPPQTPAVSWEVPPQAVTEYGPLVTDTAFLAAVLPVVATAVGVGVVVMAVGAVMEFVLVDALRSRHVRVLGPFGDRLGAGLRVFALRAGVTLAVLLAGAGVFVPVSSAVTTGTARPLLALVVTVPLLLLVGTLAALVSEFTTAFVVPLMVEYGDGVLEGWRRFWPTLRAEWRQFAAYVLVKVVLLFGAGVVFSLAGAIIAAPAGLVLFGGGVTPAAAVAVSVAALVGLAVLAAASVPVVSYLRYHSLCTLDASPAAFTLR